MTTDIEEELRELFHDKAAGAPTAVPSTPAAAPREILRRGRLHQIGTVVGSALVAGLLVVGSVAGLQAILGEPGFETGPPGDDISPSPVPVPRSDAVELAGFDGQKWSVRFTGAFADGTECMEFTIAEASTVLCPTDDALRGTQPFLHGYDGERLHLLAGAVPIEVAKIRFTSDVGTTLPTTGRCDTGPAGWIAPDKDVCAIALPSEDSGTLQYLDAGGSVLYEEGLGWGSASASPPPSVSTGIPTPVHPTHGGTYWAVYAWVGSPGDPAAEDTSAMLLDRFGIEAFPGDLACDQGAADALGTDAEQGIAVYFETEEDAGTFALRAGLLDHERKVIARVTTYCLD